MRLSRNGLQNLITVTFLVLFLWQTFQSCHKFMKAQTVFSTSHQVRWSFSLPLEPFKDLENILSQDDGAIWYPSVTVCKEYIFDDYQDHEQAGLNVEEDQLMQYLHDHTWSREQLFYFVTHAKMFDNRSFPCTTSEGGSDPGKPCSFPYLYDGKLVTGCQEEFCYTRWRGVS